MHGATLEWMTVLGTAVDVAVAAAVLLRRPRENGVGVARVVQAGAAVVALNLLKAPFLVLAGLGPFGFVRLIYAHLAVGLPALAMLLFVLHARHVARLTLPAAAVAAAALLGAPVGAYASFVEPYRLQLERASLELSPVRAGKSPVRIGVLADLQTDRVGVHERAAVARLVAEHPDVILLPGDLFQGTAAQLDEQRAALRELLRDLRAPGGTFVVEGDMDRVDELRDLCAGTGVEVLHQQTATVAVGDRTLRIAGVATAKAFSVARRYARSFRKEVGADDVRILLAHHPDIARGLDPGGRIDLVVAGHTHGGQVVVPGFGPPITLSGVPRSVGAGGLHELDGVQVYVSRGVGCERGQAPQIRFLCPPEITVIELR